jgi:hypothetical protein
MEYPVSGIDEADPKGRATYRAALAAVIILSGLFVLGLIALAVGMVRQYQIHLSGHGSGQAAPAGAAASITLAPGAHIVSAATESGKLVLHVRTPDGDAVEIFDLSTGRLTAQIRDGGK